MDRCHNRNLSSLCLISSLMRHSKLSACWQILQLWEQWSLPQGCFALAACVALIAWLCGVEHSRNIFKKSH